jgi:hypothetical protein
MKNIQVGYNLPKSLVSRAKLQAAKIYLSGENLFSWSPLYKVTKDLDVESIGRSDMITNPNPTDNAGNGNNYPILKSFTLGLNITL